MTTHDKNAWSSPRNPLQTTAAAWFVRVQNDDLDVDEIAEWQQWLAESPAHREAFDQMCALWEDLGKLPDRTLPALASGDRVEETPRAAADARTCVKDSTHSSALDDHPGDSARQSEADADGPRMSLWPRTLAACVLLAVALASFYALYGEGMWLRPQTTVFTTRPAEHLQVALPDGSTLWLGAQSLVWIKFSADKRNVVLERGEAFFEVAKNKRRPFKVSAGSASITAVGTAFNVRKADERVLVGVSEGAVRFARASHDRPDPDFSEGIRSVGGGFNTATETASQRRVPLELELRAGQQVVFEGSTDTLRVREAAPETMSAWRSGRLEYIGEPLKYVVADINRYSKRPIVIEDPAIGELLVTGTVFERDIDAWLRSAADILPVSIDRSAGDRIVLVRRTSGILRPCSNGQQGDC